VESRDRQRIIRRGLDQLSVEHRAALELVFYQGLNLNEAAVVLACPVGTVKSRLSYAKTWLRGWLVKEGLGAEEVE
jgi:RNA polymerase sigma-70 factor (ECF subfamily)